MCGIFGIISATGIDKGAVKTQARFAERRGKDSSGLLYYENGAYRAVKADYETTRLVSETDFHSPSVVLGHSRLITNGMSDNQPVIRDGVAVLHNGIIINHEEIWPTLSVERDFEIDTEVIAGVILDAISEGQTPDMLANSVISRCVGMASCAILIAERGLLILLSNNGSLYVGEKEGRTLFASEKHSLERQKCVAIEQVVGHRVLDVPKGPPEIGTSIRSKDRANLIPVLRKDARHEKLLEYRSFSGKRCSRCILPDTMPFIAFDDKGVCNYCLNHTTRNNPRPMSELENLVSPYRRAADGPDCIIPFSGGRDSTYALHVVVNELQLKPITFTYDWGMVTDLARRNISRVCSRLKVENIVVADDIQRKRGYIAANLKAWLKSPHLGMLNILMAGDKHFFRYLEDIKEETGIELNIWGMCPLETTHFKAGFLGIPPYFEERKVYTSGIGAQLRYQTKRFREMARNPSYINRSLWDTLYGEYYRSIRRKSGYFHLFDYHRWNEMDVNQVLDIYEWEKAPDTDSTWRIGDGTAAFYNYVYRTVAGFSEHDTFRSNQIREGDISRSDAMEMIEKENRPRYQNIRWYLDTLGLDFESTIKVVNSIPKLFAA